MTTETAPEVEAPTLVPAVIPYGKAAGRTTTKILFEPDSELFVCADCHHADSEYGRLLGHRRTHAEPSSSVAERLDAMAAIVAGLRSELGRPEGKPDLWRQRALEAEARLAKVERRLAGLRKTFERDA